MSVKIQFEDDKTEMTLTEVNASNVKEYLDLEFVPTHLIDDQTGNTIALSRCPQVLKPGRLYRVKKKKGQKNVKEFYAFDKITCD